MKVNNIKKVNLVLLIILVIAAIVRYWGIDFGLPHTEVRTDESVVVNIAIKFGTGDLNPHFFLYPTFYMYILFSLYVCYFVFGIITGKYRSTSDFEVEFIQDPTSFYLIARFFSAFLGTATVFITYKLAERLFNKKIAIISALFMSLAYLHVRDSHFGMTDVTMTFLITCSLLFIVKSYQDKTLKNYVMGGIFAGLAMSTKYIGILLLVPMSIAHFSNILDEKDKKVALLLDKRMLFFTATLGFAFLVGTPFALLDSDAFIPHILRQTEITSRGVHTVFLGIGWWYHLRVSLFFGLGWSLLFASLAGILILAKTDLRKAMILFSFSLVYYVLIGKAQAVFVRYMIPIIPVLCITAAIFTVDISDKLARFFSKPHLKNMTTFLVAGLIILPSTYNVIKFDALLAKKDNRLIAAEWINKNIPGDSSIYQFGDRAVKIQLDPTLESLEKQYETLMAEGDSRETVEAKKLRVKIDCSRRENIRGYDQWMYHPASGEFTFNGDEKNGLPDYIIISKSPLVMYSKIPEGITKPLKTSYSLKKSFEVIDVSNKENLFDQQDAFYVPFIGFSDVQRPGPNIYIYEKNGQ